MSNSQEQTISDMLSNMMSKTPEKESEVAIQVNAITVAALKPFVDDNTIPGDALLVTLNNLRSLVR